MEEELKRASWIELFYDVAYVALVAQLTYLAAEYHKTSVDLINIFIIGYSIFIAWWTTTANRNLQPSETDTDKFLIQVQMVGAFFMSLSMANVFQGEYLGFFLTLGLVRVLQIFMVLRMYAIHPKTRPNTYNLLQGFIFAASLWLVSAFLPAPYNLIIALSALAIDILVPLTRGKGNTKRYLNVFHLQERLGLFLMLVIGESMIVVALSNTAVNSDASPTTMIFSGLGLMIALWWLYFEHSDEHAGRRPNNLFLYLHSHGFLFGSLILISVAYKLVLSGGFSASALNFLLVGAIGLSLSLLAIRSTQHKLCLLSVYKTAIMVLLGLVGIWFGYRGEWLEETIIGISVIFFIVAVLDRFKYFRDPEGKC